MVHLKSSAIAAAALAAAVVMFAGPVGAQQRLSLAERIERLEQQANGQGNGAVDLVNQNQALQSQVQALQGQVEELKHALDEARQRNKDQYTDLDSRIGRLEGHGAGAAAPPPGAARAAPPEQPPEVDLGNPAASVQPPASTAQPSARNVGALTDEDRAVIAAGEAASSTNARQSAPAQIDPAAEGSTYNDAFAALKDGRYADSARRA
jgi:TolA-binding protein